MKRSDREPSLSTRNSTNGTENTPTIFSTSTTALAGLRSVGSFVDRTMRLTKLRAATTPSKQTNYYIAEATRAYIYGLSMASVAMSRAALEQSLKERLGLQNSGEFYELKHLMLEASEVESP